MTVVINGSGTITGISTGGLPDGIVDDGTLATSAVTSTKILDGTITTTDMSASDVKSLKSGRKNLIINGGMSVAQRGTSQTTNGYGSLDRFRLALSGATGTLSQETFTIGQTDVPNEPKNYLKLDVTTGNNNCGFEQRIEDVRSTAGRSFILSFYAKGVSPAGGSVYFNAEQQFAGSTAVSVTGGSFALTSSWQKFEISITFPSITGKTVGSSSYVRLQISQYTDTGTAAWNLNIANLQLELGSTATDFEHRSYGEELALCQRYFEWLYKAGDAFGYSYGWPGGNYVPYLLRVEKRVIPTVISSGGVNIFSNAAAYGYSAVNQGSNGVRSGEVYISGTSRAGFVRSTSGSYALDAEL